MNEKFKNLKKKRKAKDNAEDDLEDDQPASKKPRIDESEYKRYLNLLKQEMKKKKPKSKVVKQSLDETMDERRRWIEIDCPTALDVVIMYPPLRVQRWVSC